MYFNHEALLSRLDTVYILVSFILDMAHTVFHFCISKVKYICKAKFMHPVPMGICPC